MRVLFTAVVGYGHVLPMLPLAHALTDTGHEVAFATDPSFGPRIEEYGYQAFAAGMDHREALAGLAAAYPNLSSMPFEERMRIVFPGLFARIRLRPMLADLDRLLPAWRPQLLIHDTGELAGPIAAGASGIAHVEHSFGIRRPADVLAAAIAEREPVALERGLEDPGINGNRGETYIDICPPSLQETSVVAGPNVVPLRSAADELDADTPLPAWADRLGARPCLYVTLGTVSNHAVHVFRAVLDGVADEDVDVVLTIGPEGDPAALGQVADNVHVERFLPQGAVLRRCAVAISHAGSGAMLGAAAAGVPVLAVPQAADQFLNAQTMADAGMALRLMPDEVSPDAIRLALRRLLDEPAFRERARAIGAEIQAMPAPSSVVPRLVALAS
jgi:UDP:flavonoid glycosyltransferase YjiC (YdhE family)